MRETIFNLKRVYTYGKKYKRCLIFQLLSCIVGIVVNVVLPILIAELIVSITETNYEKVICVALWMLGLKVIDEIKTVVMRKNTQIFRRGTIKNLQIELMSNILNMEQEEIDTNSNGVFIQRITNDTDNMAKIFTSGMSRLRTFLSNISCFIAILILDYRVFAFYFVSTLILIFLNYIKNKKIGKKEKEYKKQTDEILGFSNEIIRGTKDIKILNCKENFLNKYERQIEKQTKLNFSLRNTEISYNFFINNFKNILELVTVVLLIACIKNFYITAAVAIALYNYRTAVLADLMETLSDFFDECRTFNISANRVFELLDNEKYKKEKFGNTQLDRFYGKLEFNNVNFSYNKDNRVLDNLSFEIKPNKIYGIVGKSGEGKTTIFNLITKLYKINGGEILFDGVNINELDEKSIRGNVSFINQNPYIFNCSIKENLRLVKNDITDEEIEQVCNLVCLDNYINSLSKKYDSIVGEGGETLSGGQKQRLAIARSLIQNNKIILLDEATSALDNETQTNIQNAINNLKENYTIIIIAHRLSTIINCDEIFMVSNGKIVHKGTHKELLENCKQYKDLYECENSATGSII